MKDELLENFMKEFFPFNEMVEIGFFKKEMKGDYRAQADRVCQWFGYKTVYEYGKDEAQAHLSYAPGNRPKEEPFVRVTPSIYD